LTLRWCAGDRSGGIGGRAELRAVRAGRGAGERCEGLRRPRGAAAGSGGKADFVKGEAKRGTKDEACGNVPDSA
jgi:hypothetical protein